MLHAEMKKYVRPETSFEALYHYINELIRHSGYENLDFMGNLGHSIVKNKEDRIYIEKGNQSKLCDVSFFTFEPHIRMQNFGYGFKKENIYYFKGDELLEL